MNTSMNAHLKIAAAYSLIMVVVAIALIKYGGYRQTATEPVTPTTAPEPLSQFQYVHSGDYNIYIHVIMDTVTGCYYLYTGHGAITPRNWSNGTQMCVDNPEPSIPYPDEYPDEYPDDESPGNERSPRTPE